MNTNISHSTTSRQPRNCQIVSKLINSQHCFTGLISTSTLGLQTVNVKPATSVWSLGVAITLSFNEHVDNVCKSSYFHLRTLRHIRNHISEDMTKSIVCSMSHGRLEYCNSVLHSTCCESQASKVLITTPGDCNPTPILADQNCCWASNAPNRVQGCSHSAPRKKVPCSDTSAFLQQKPHLQFETIYHNMSSQIQTFQCNILHATAKDWSIADQWPHLRFFSTWKTQPEMCYK